MNKFIFFVSILLVTCVSCENNSEDDLIDNTPVNETSYTENIKPIIDNNCIFCHSNPPINGAPNPLTTLEEVKVSVEDNLVQRISLQSGETGFMPIGGTRLPQSIIDLIVQWSGEDFPE